MDFARYSSTSSIGGDRPPFDLSTSVLTPSSGSPIYRVFRQMADKVMRASRVPVLVVR